MQYGRKDIETVQNEKRKHKPDGDSEDEGYSEELAPPEQSIKAPAPGTPKNIKSNCLTNGHVANGGNNLIRFEFINIIINQIFKVKISVEKIGIFYCPKQSTFQYHLKMWLRKVSVIK